MRFPTRWAFGAAVAAVAALGFASDSIVPPFAAVQQAMLAVPGSLSNAWADFDNDGDIDLAASLGSGGIRLYRNDDGELVDIGAMVGLPTGGPMYRGLSWGDYDGDGWLDLFAGAGNHADPSALFRNLNGGKFVDVAAQTGLVMPGRASRQNNWVDYDNDGDVDLYATDRSGANRLYRNDGGVFVAAFPDGGPTTVRATVGACWLDYDRDGDLDLFLANQSGNPDELWRNDGDGFSNVAPVLGMDRPGRPEDEGSVGCAIGDYDNDGNLDIFVASYGINVLWRGRDDGSFKDVADETGVGIRNHAVGAAFGDWDNDGFPDLAMMGYEGTPGQLVPHDSLFHNIGGKRFVNVLAREDPLNAGDHGVAWVDYDRDGAVDLSLTRSFGSEGGHFVFRNLLPRERAARSLSVLVLDAKGHFTQAGAEVRIYTSSGRLLGTGQVQTGGGFNAQNAIPVHLGVPEATEVVVEVTFMDAAGRQVQRIPGIRIGAHAGKSLVVRRAD